MENSKFKVGDFVRCRKGLLCGRIVSVDPDETLDDYFVEITNTKDHIFRTYLSKSGKEWLSQKWFIRNYTECIPIVTAKPESFFRWYRKDDISLICPLEELVIKLEELLDG